MYYLKNRNLFSINKSTKYFLKEFGIQKRFFYTKEEKDIQKLGNFKF